MAHILRLSVSNGTFVFCRKQDCDLFDFEKNSLIGEKSNKSQSHEHFPEYPHTLMIGIDHNCNLKCPSCREDIIIADKNEKKKIEKWAEELLENAVPYVKRLWLAGSGEVFFSTIYKNILADRRCQKRANINVLSNGTLFDENKWKLLEKNYKTIEIVLSIDDVRNETIY